MAEQRGAGLAEGVAKLQAEAAADGPPHTPLAETLAEPPATDCLYGSSTIQHGQGRRRRTTARFSADDACATSARGAGEQRRRRRSTRAGAAEAAALDAPGIDRSVDLG